MATKASNTTAMAAGVHVASFHKGDHICLFYRDAAEQLSTAGPFVHIGLLRGERCLCVLPPPQIEALLASLDAGGIDPDKEVARGALLTIGPEDAYMRGGAFNRDEMIKLLDDGMREALKLGFTGFRGTGDVSWSARDSNACAQMPEYEAMLDCYYPGKSSLGICMYNAALFSDAQLNELMNVHRLALTHPSPNKRAIRIRDGEVFGDVIFDRESPRLFHYTVQKKGVNELFNLGQESTLTAAMDAVKSSLRALHRTMA